MVTRCIKALDRLDEVSQRLYKKSSLQAKLSKIESRLNQLTKKPSRDNELRERCSIRKKNKYQAVFHDTSGTSVIKHTPEETQSSQRKFQKNSGPGLKGCRRTKKVQIKHPTIRGKSKSKLPDRKHNVKSISVDETGLENDEKCVAELKSPRGEPLSWEEQINAKQVKILEKRQPSITTYPNNEIDSHPVIFHDKKWVEEMLHKKATQFHFSSSCCPLKFQENEECKSNKRTTVKCLNTEHLESKHDKLLQLRGRGVPFYSHEMNDELSQEILFSTINGIVPKMPMTAHHQDQQNGQSTEDNNCGLVLLKDKESSTTTKQCISTDTSPHSLSSSKTVVHPVSKQYVDISVCVPNAHCVEEQADESCSLVSDTKDLNFQIKSLLSSSEISVDGERQYSSAKSSNQLIKSADRSRPVSKTSNVENDEEFCYKREDSPRKKIMIYSSNSSPNVGRIKDYPERPQRPSSLVYTPSSPPLFLANEVVELPRGVSPSKALMELRQSFCENIRKETKQLEFDLQELYLKKHLHKR